MANMREVQRRVGAADAMRTGVMAAATAVPIDAVAATVVPTSRDGSSKAQEQQPHHLRSPAEHMRSLFTTSKKRPRSTTTDASDEDLNGYTMESVQAVRTNNLAVLRCILQRRDGARLLSSAKNRSGESLLHLACRRANVDTVRFLIDEAQVDVTVVDELGRHCLHDVCWRPRVDEALEIMALFVKVVPPHQWLQCDVRGHACLDYCRREHWEQWNTFIEEQVAATLQRRLKLIEGLCTDDY